MVLNEKPAIFIHFHSKNILMGFIHINMWMYYKPSLKISKKKVKCVFQNSWNDFVVSGFEVIALDDGIFQRSIVKKLAFNYVIKLKLTAVIYLGCCKITCLTILMLSLLFKTSIQQNKCNFVQKCCTGNRDVIARDSSYMGV